MKRKGGNQWNSWLTISDNFWSFLWLHSPQNLAPYVGQLLGTRVINAGNATPITEFHITNKQ